jgi:hypothetical protein
MSDIEVDLTPTKDTFVLGEPVSVKMTLKNISSRELRLTLAYPRDLMLSFSCDDEDAVPAPMEVTGDRRIPIMSLSPNEEYVVVLALNRYLEFGKPKRYLIKYLAEYGEYPRGDNRRPKNHSASGKFSVEIKDAPLDKELIKALEESVTGQDEQNARQAVELSLWVNDPSMIDTLEKGAIRFPDAGADVIEALGKFRDSDKAQAAILRLAKSEGSRVLRAAFRVWEKRKITPPDDLYRKILSSKGTSKRYMTLQYLLKHGNARHLPFVAPLTSDSNENIAGLAEAFVTKFERDEE